MKKFNKAIVALLVLVMCMVLVPMTALATNTEGVEYNATLDKSTIDPSAEPQQIVMTVKANKAFPVDAIGMTVLIPEGWTLASVENEDLGFAASNVNLAVGAVNYATSDAEDWSTDLVVKVTYNVPADVAAGTYELGINELVISKEYGTTWEHYGSASVTLTVTGAAHTCTHDHYNATETTHQSVCACGEAIGEAVAHSGGTATCNTKANCATCGVEYGDVDKTNHVGETELRNAVAASCGDPGYTGDTCCKACDTILAEGEEIEPTGNHTGGTATCMAGATCEICGLNYGELDPENHAGNIIQRENVTQEPTCDEPGMKIVTDFCDKCMCLIAEQEVEIPATGNHVDADDAWESDGINHFHTCGCGTKFDEGEHIGGAATCMSGAICETCGLNYGELDSENHAGNIIQRENVTQEPTCDEPGMKIVTDFCDKCMCLIAEQEVEIPATDQHTGGTATCANKAVCEVCGKEYGDVNKENHTGEYVTHNVVEETCGVPGYTGDLHCKDCDTLLEKGEEIPATGSHTGGTATCTKQAICDVCDQAYGEVDYTNHVGEEELVDASEATCVEDGYTGDIWCLACDEMKVRGQILPATGEHVGTYRFTWQWNAEQTEVTLVVWFYCGTCQSDVAFENVTDVGVITKDPTCHDTGVRTYTFDMSNAELPEKCSWNDFALLNNDLGNENAIWNYETKTMTLTVAIPVDPANHVGETEIRDAAEATCGDPGYTGDTYCKACDTKLAEGKEIEPTGDHKGGTATCMACAVCEVCGQSYGELDPENHAGDVLQRENVTKEPTCDEPGMKIVTDFCDKCMCSMAEREVEIPATGQHTGGTATCVNKAVCEVCGKEYGEKDRDNHNWNEKWYQDDQVHWHECDDCHEGKDMKEHYDNDGDKKCDECGYIFESIPNTGEAQVIGTAVIAMLIAACGVVLVFKKRRNIC